MNKKINFIGQELETKFGITDFIVNGKRYTKTSAGIWLDAIK